MKQQKIMQYIGAVTEQMSFAEARPSVRRELQTHIEEQIEDARSYGLSEEESVSQALKRMGNAQEIGQSLNQIHQSKTDFVSLAVVLILCLIGWGTLASTSDWAPLQAVWIFLGGALAALAIRLPYVKLQNTLAGLYPLAVAGLIAAQFSGLTIDRQPYLVIFGLKIKIVDLSAVLIALSFPALEKFVKRALPLLILLPLIYFVAIGSLFPAMILLAGGILASLRSYWNTLFVATLGTVTLSFSRLEMTDTREAHTDFILDTLYGISGTGATLALALVTALMLHLLFKTRAIQTEWLRVTASTALVILGLESVFGSVANLGLAPMFKTGVNFPFLSYGGSLMVAHLFSVGVILACLRRKSVKYI